MSLVAYDSSDESDEDKIKPTLSKQLDANGKKQREKRKITIPSLKEFQEDDETPVVKKPKSVTGSGLFSLLPPPKNSSTLSKPGFMPHILKSKKEQLPSSPKGSKKESSNAQINSAPSVTLGEEDSDEETPSTPEKSAEENTKAAIKNDFFWLDDLAGHEKNESSYSVISKNNTFLQNLSSHLPPASNSLIHPSYQHEPTGENYFQQYQEQSETDTFHMEENPEDCFSSEEQSNSLQSYPSTEPVLESGASDSLLKDKEFLKLQGRRREFENVDIIDVNADDQLTNKKEWLLRNLTEKSTYRPSRKKHNMPTQQQKRKHQITYLAFQAKEREMDLKNQWALNSRTRRETQAKYGF